MAKFTSRKEQLAVAHKLLIKLEDKNTGGVTPIIKSIISYNLFRLANVQSNCVFISILTR